ncbi:lamin tail domain-containing protein [Pontiellaceae bacterium B12227]|nr:lamin tail domain-containing protein [Pontiellaceae bacterium B12227]
MRTLGLWNKSICLAGVMTGIASAATVVVEPPGACTRKTGFVISEIMYRPATTNALEFIEVYNSNPFEEEIGGYRFKGEIDFTFPAGTMLAGESYLVVAKDAAAFQQEYALSGVQLFEYGETNGGNSLGRSGNLRLINSCDGTVLEIDYDNDAPWPVAANGAGHSLVLARPSYGENDPQAWEASDQVGGSPGTGESYGEVALRNVVINEILAHTDDPQLDTIELYNHSNTPVDLSGCTLSDEASTNKFTIPAGTVLAARGYVIFNQLQMGFFLNSGGETIYFRNAAGTRMIDAVQFGGQENGISIGRYPNGGGQFHRMAGLTLGSGNGARRIDDVVINEIMYDPISGDNDDEFVELYNQGSGTADLSSWRLRGGISFTFPDGASIPAGGYVVVARDALRLQTNYAQLNASNTFGDYSGKLGNGGDRIKLNKPDTVIDYDELGNPETNLIHITVDDITYGTGGQWPVWAKGGGSSLERVDARANPRRPTAWADSDETGKATWTDISVTGLLQHGSRGASRIEGGLQGAGECLLDNVQVVSDSGNHVNNPTFDTGLSDWVIRGSFERSSQDSNGYGGTSCLHIRASTRCDTGANKISGALSSSVADGSTATISAKAKWQKGYPWLYLRLYGNYLEAPVRLDIPANLGTPGQANSQALGNAAPAIDEVSHAPAVPSAGEALVVTARAEDPDGLAILLLNYRLDPSTSYTSVTMTDNGTAGDAVAGDGIFSGSIPGQSAGTLVAFYIASIDPAGSSVRRFPGNTPDNYARLRECLVRFGAPTRASSFGTYRMWFTAAATTDWETRLALSNEPVEGTFVYNDSRVIYNFGAHYVGSPYHQGWTGITDDCHYSMDMPLDDKLLGTDNFNKLHGPGNNPFQDQTMTREQAGFWVARKLKLPWLYRRYVNVYVNGVARKAGWLMEDTQVPGSEFIEQYWRKDADGHLHKSNYWWEYTDFATTTGTQLTKKRQSGTQLLPFYNALGELHAPRYRWAWGPRAYGKTGGNDFSHVLKLIEAANSGDDMAEQMLAEADMEEWMRIWALRHAVGDMDHFGCSNPQNMYMYKPTEGRWALMIWDMNHLLGNNLSFAPGHGLFPDYSDYQGDTTLTAVYENPLFRRMYLRALKEISGSVFQSSEMTQWLDVRYDAFIADGLATGSQMSPDAIFSDDDKISKLYEGRTNTLYFTGSIKDWIEEARVGILARVAQEDTASFALTSPASVSTSSNLVTITGTAPVEVASMTVNGIEYPVIWTSVTEWSIDAVAASSPATFALQGLDVYGVPIIGTSATVSVTVTGGLDAPEDTIVINEILYNPTVPGGEFVELHNRSANTAFDLTGWRMNGLGYTFPVTLLAPGEYLVLDDFDGTLDLDGETLTLYQPVGTNGAEAVVDQVRYETTAPWPIIPAGTSLQLMDAEQDNRRAALWAAADGLAEPPTGETLINWGDTWKYRQGVDLDGTGWQTTGYNDAAWPSGPAAFGFDNDPLPHPIQTPLTLGTITYYFRKTINFTGQGGASLKLTTMVDDGLVVYLDGVEINRLRMPTGTPTYTTTTTSYVPTAYEEGPVEIVVGLQPGTHVIAVELHQTSTKSSDVAFDMKVESDYSALSAEVATPGMANNVSYPNAVIPALWLNEVMPSPVSGMPWVELYNAGETTLSLSGYSLGDDYGDLDKWPVTAPASIFPGAFVQINLGAGVLTNGRVALSRDVGGSREMIDYLNYGTVAEGWSYGDYPDGNPCARLAMYAATPGAANTNQSAPLDARMNEWMADNDSTLADAMDDDYEDWFEIYNPGDAPVDLGGYFLTDDLADPYQFEVPMGGKYTIPSHGFLLVWADNESGQNAVDPSALHVNFALSKSGETIALVASDGSVIDSVTFGPQITDQSEGRMSDGGPVIVEMEPTPGAPNQVINTAPVLNAVADVQLYPGETITFTAVATDAESAFQTLEFSLEPGAPAGATITSGGTFSWTVPTAMAPSAWPTTIRVADNGTPVLDDTEPFMLHVNALPHFDSDPASTGNGLVLEVETITGRDYYLTYKDSLSDTYWLPQGDAKPGNGSPLEFEVSTTNAPRRFYQLLVE